MPHQLLYHTAWPQRVPKPQGHDAERQLARHAGAGPCTAVNTCRPLIRRHLHQWSISCSQHPGDGKPATGSNLPFPIPAGARRSRRGLTGRPDPCGVLRCHSRSPRCGVWGLLFLPAAQGLFGSCCTKPRAEQAACSSMALPALASALRPLRKVRPLIQAPRFWQCLTLPHLWEERDEHRARRGGQRAASSRRAERQNQQQPAASAGEQKAPAQSHAQDNAAAPEHCIYSLQSLTTCPPDNPEHKFRFCK